MPNQLFEKSWQWQLSNKFPLYPGLIAKNNILILTLFLLRYYDFFWMAFFSFYPYAPWWWCRWTILPLFVHMHHPFKLEIFVVKKENQGISPMSIKLKTNILLIKHITNAIYFIIFAYSLNSDKSRTKF